MPINDCHWLHDFKLRVCRCRRLIIFYYLVSLNAVDVIVRCVRLYVRLRTFRHRELICEQTDEPRSVILGKSASLSLAVRVCVSVQVYVCILFANMYIEHNHLHRIEHFQLNGASPVFSSLVVIFVFKVNYLVFELSFANIS